MTDRINSLELRNAYDERFKNNDLRDSDSFYQWVFKHLHAAPGQKLLDVACGSGRLLYHARQFGVRTFGLDFSIEGLRRERGIDNLTELVLADGQYLPLPDQSMDYVANLGSLEHFVDPGIGIKEMARVLKPDGTVAIVLPNAFYAGDLIWWVWRKGRSASHKQPIERFAAYNNWRELLDDNGLQVTRGWRYNFMFPKTRLDIEFYRRFPKKLIDLAVSPFIPFNFSYSFLYICKKIT
jgi:SAM-dependent methyltransferase